MEGEKMEGMKIRISTVEIKKIQYPKSEKRCDLGVSAVKMGLTAEAQRARRVAPTELGPTEDS